MRQVKIGDRTFDVRGLKRREVKELKKQGLDLTNIGAGNIIELQTALFAKVLSEEEIAWLYAYEAPCEIVAGDHIFKFVALSHTALLGIDGDKDFAKLDNQGHIDYILEMVLDEDQLTALDEVENKWSIKIVSEAKGDKAVQEVFFAAMKETFGSVEEEKN